MFNFVSTPSERHQAELKASLEAAAVPRWCDPALLSALLRQSPERSAEHLASLRDLGMAQRAAARGEAAVQVPDAVRTVLRRVLATVEPDRFRVLTLRAAEHFREQPGSAARIEWVFHLLCGDPERGADALAELDREWTDGGHSAERQALAAALRELEETGMVAGRARAWVLLTLGWTHEFRGEAAQWAAVEEKALRTAREAGDVAAEAEALCAIGDARLAQYKFPEAEAAYEDLLALSRRLAGERPEDTGWQRKLALAWGRLGETGQARGRLDAAQSAFAEYLATCRRMARLYPDDTGWQQDLAVAHSKLGHVLKAQGHLERARAEFLDYLAVFRRLVKREPGNLGWQRELAIACGLVAEIRSTLDGAMAALPYYEESARILAGVVAKAPDVAQWAEDKRRIDESLATCRRLAEARKLMKNGLSWLQDKLPF
jgi:tetratricopeptide (TPR) repeat protein